MKKLLFVAAIGVAGFMSASSPIKENTNDLSKEKEKTELNCKSENQAEVKNQVKDVKIKEEPFITCVVVHLSCGWDSFICGYSWFEIITDSMDADERVCG